MPGIPPSDLEVAEAAHARYGWQLHVIEGAAGDPSIEQPVAFLHALRLALENGQANPQGEEG